MERYFSFDRYKSLEELESGHWEEPPVNTHLVVTCTNLRRKPVGYFTVEDLRIMIGQNIGLEYLLPLALESLEDNLFTQGDLYAGDLLDMVLNVKAEFWRSNPLYKKDLENILDGTIKDLERKLRLLCQSD